MKRRFAWNFNTKHPCYILSEGRGCYFYVSITHAPYWNGNKTIHLDMKDRCGKDLYIIPLILTCDKNKISSYDYDLKFTYKDGSIIRDLPKIIKKLYNI